MRLISIFTKVALQISPYLFLRSANIINLEWKEVDFDKKIIIRANKVKAREDFIIPLSQSVLGLLLYVKNFSYSDLKYVFFKWYK